jgi:1-deoxy-D-xylulose-5-phosphate reductoisomerase
MTDQRRVVVLGSTGSIGTQAIAVARAAPDRFRVTAICSGGGDLALLADQAVALRVAAVGVGREDAGPELQARLAAKWPTDSPAPEVLVGRSTAVALAAYDADVVLNAIAGAEGLRATLASLDAGRIVALANKESLVAGGPLVTGRAKPGQLVAVDSEHSALAQCLRSGSADEVSRLILTASGGPFRGRRREQLTRVTPEQALAHPTWDMGKLITTNSATLVNKGLEVIEAHLLFGVPYERIAVVVHPQSVVHSMVEYVDGATIAQASPPDMRLPIALALGWPDRVPGAAPSVDWSKATSWTAGRAGGVAPAVYNAANEELVAAFHAGHVSFLGIVDTVRDVLMDWLSNHHAAAGNPGTVEDVEYVQDWARARARAVIAQQS